MAIPKFKCRNNNCRSSTIEYSVAIMKEGSDSFLFADGDKTPSYCPYCSKNILIDDDVSNEAVSVSC